MRTLKYVAMIGVFLFGINAANAQKRKSHQNHRSQKHLNMKKGYHKMNDTIDFHKRWAKEIELSDEQKEQIKSIRSENKDKMMALRGEMRDLKKAERENIQSIFTPEQKEKMKEMHAKRKDQMKKKRSDRKDWRKKRDANR